jgi:hypothetical protein
LTEPFAYEVVPALGSSGGRLETLWADLESQRASWRPSDLEPRLCEAASHQSVYTFSYMPETYPGYAPGFLVVAEDGHITCIENRFSYR